MKHTYFALALTLCSITYNTQHAASFCPETFYCDPEKKRVTDARYLCCATYEKYDPQTYANSIDPYYNTELKKYRSSGILEKAAAKGPYSNCLHDALPCTAWADPYHNSCG